jgi:hypothetical protein
VGAEKSDTEKCVVSVDYTRISTEDSHSGRAASNVAYWFCFADRLQSSRYWAWTCSPRTE